MSVFFGGKFQLDGSIGSGSFGEIFLAKNLKTGEDLAAKVEKVKNRAAKSQLRREAKIYRILSGAGIPKLKWFGEFTDRNIMVMELLGRSLEDQFNYCNRTFTLKTVLLLAYEMVSRIETVHSQGKLIHRDIKPENFLIGRNRDRHTVYIIDFGLAKHYCNPKTGRHTPCKEGNSLTGTARYASINAHKGLEQARRDDLFSIGYVLMYFLRGSLPWQGLKTQAQLREESQFLNGVQSGVDGPQLVPPAISPVPHNINQDNTEGGVLSPGQVRTPTRPVQETEEQEKYRLILERKQATPVEELCRGFPGMLVRTLVFKHEFVRYFEHLQTLAFEDTPDYNYLKALFRDLFRRSGYVYESVLYDWEVRSEQKQAQQQKQRQR